MRKFLWMSLSNELYMCHSLTFRSSARMPRTMVTTVGVIMQENIQRFKFCEEVIYLVEDENATEALRVSHDSLTAVSRLAPSVQLRSPMTIYILCRKLIVSDDLQDERRIQSHL